MDDSVPHGAAVKQTFPFWLWPTKSPTCNERLPYTHKSKPIGPQNKIFTAGEGSGISLTLPTLDDLVGRDFRSFVIHRRNLHI
jgi:hypothetical protein